MNDLTESSSTEAMVLSAGSMQHAINFATMMSGSIATIPKHLQGSAPDCLAVTMQAMQWGMNPFAVAQKTHIVSGTLGYEAQLVNAVISSSTAIDGRFHYEYSDDKTWAKANDHGAWVKVGAILKGEAEIQWGEPLYVATVTTKNSPLWKTAPKQQAGYLALKYWARLYCPAVMLGVYTTDEIKDFKQEERDITPEKPASALRKPEPEAQQEPEQPAIDAEFVAEVPDLIPATDLLTAMGACQDIATLDAVKEDAIKYPEGDDRQALVDAYKECKKAILLTEDAGKLNK